MENNTPLLGDWKPTAYHFPDLQKIFNHLKHSDFQKLSLHLRYDQINRMLFDLILKAPEPAFLFSAVLAFIDLVNKERLLSEPFRFTSFEFWLNNISKATDAQNALVRAKVVGKKIPREAYQVFFPIGMNKIFPGSHFVSAHLSPDVDTMIASFWGWMDAFGARVGTGQHQWSLPGGAPDSPITTIFQESLGSNVLSAVARTAPTLTLSSIDLVTQKNFRKEKAATSISTLDHGSNEKAVILVDDQEHYLGDWRSSDVELVRQIIILFKACFRWFENRFHTLLITLFAKDAVHLDHFDTLLDTISNATIAMSDPAQDFSEEQKTLLNDLIAKVFDLPQGIHVSFYQLMVHLKEQVGQNISQVIETLAALRSGGLFDQYGSLIESRPIIFSKLEMIFSQLNKATITICNYVERLDVVMRIKTAVLETPLQYLMLGTDVEEIRLKLKNHDYLTVVISEEQGKLYPLGVVWAKDLRKKELGTISLRDFCNLDEIKMASYLSVISVIDHHKTALKTGSPPLAIIGDVQSCNVLIAEQTLQLNNKYSLEGMEEPEIQRQQAANQTTSSLTTMRLAQRLLQRQLVAEFGQEYYIHPQREMIEYLTFLHAILDDTDLLTKVSDRDVECVVQILNRMKSIQLKQQLEIINLDDIPRHPQFAKVAAKKILQHPDMFSIYERSYLLREKEVEDNLNLGAEGQSSLIFADTKELNGCCRVGQTKMFSSNVPTFSNVAPSLRKSWIKTAQEINKNYAEIDLHMQMITTIATAKEVYGDQTERFKHQDEIWFWIPGTEQAQNHLAIFLNNFQGTSGIQDNEMNLELLGSNTEELKQIFTRNLLNISIKINQDAEMDTRLAILHYNAGSINSRKSMISPYLPQLLT